MVNTGTCEDAIVPESLEKLAAVTSESSGPELPSSTFLITGQDILAV